MPNPIASPAPLSSLPEMFTNHLRDLRRCVSVAYFAKKSKPDFLTFFFRFSTWISRFMIERSSLSGVLVVFSPLTGSPLMHRRRTRIVAKLKIKDQILKPNKDENTCTIAASFLVPTTREERKRGEWGEETNGEVILKKKRCKLSNLLLIVQV